MTQTDVARIAGVHNTTVSLALRNSPLIPDATRKRIQAVAGQLGYCPDPALRALVAYRNSCRTDRELGTLAYITNWETKWGWRDLPGHAQVFAGAQHQAAEAGYQLEHFWLGEPGMTQRRLSEMLHHRGIQGVVLASHRPAEDDLAGIDWSRLAAIRIGSYPRGPAVNRVTDDHPEMMRLALRQALAAGYRRIGLVLHQQTDESLDQAWSTAFYAEQHRHPLRIAGPAFLLRGTTPADSLALENWYMKHRPDVILGVGPGVPAHFSRRGIAVPDEVAYLDLTLGQADGQLAGIRPNSARVGELAVELLSAELLKNNLGLPAAPTVTSLGGVWCPGASFPVPDESRRLDYARGTPVRCA